MCAEIRLETKGAELVEVWTSDKLSPLVSLRHGAQQKPAQWIRSRLIKNSVAISCDKIIDNFCRCGYVKHLNLIQWGMAVGESELDDYLKRPLRYLTAALRRQNYLRQLLTCPHQQRVEQLAAMAAEWRLPNPTWLGADGRAAVAADCIERHLLQAWPPGIWHVPPMRGYQPDRVQTAVASGACRVCRLRPARLAVACDWQANAEPWLPIILPRPSQNWGKPVLPYGKDGMVAFSWQCRCRWPMATFWLANLSWLKSSWIAVNKPLYTMRIVTI